MKVEVSWWMGKCRDGRQGKDGGITRARCSPAVVSLSPFIGLIYFAALLCMDHPPNTDTNTPLTSSPIFIIFTHYLHPTLYKLATTLRLLLQIIAVDIYRKTLLKQRFPSLTELTSEPLASILSCCTFQLSCLTGSFDQLSLHVSQVNVQLVTDICRTTEGD